MILYLNCRDNDLTFNKKNYLLRAAERLDIDWVRDYNNLKGDEAKNPGYVLNIEPHGDQIIKGTEWTGIWEIDLMLSRSERSATNWAVANDVFIAINFLPSDLAGFGDKTHLLFQACDPEIHKRNTTVIPEYDFAFCGQDGSSEAYPMRKKYYELLRKKYSVKDFGTGFKPQDYVRNLSHGKIMFVRSMGKDDEDGEVAQRFFECLAIGPVLTNYIPRDMPHLGLQESLDYMVYRDEKDMLDKVDFLLANPKIRGKIAELGRKKALLYHTYEHRLMSIINTIKEHVLQKH